QRFQRRSGGCDVESFRFRAHQANHAAKAPAEKRSSFSRKGSFLIASAVWRPTSPGLKPRRICTASRAHFRSPAEFLQQRVVVSFRCVGDNFSKHWGTLDSVSAVTRSDD